MLSIFLATLKRKDNKRYTSYRLHFKHNLVDLSKEELTRLYEWLVDLNLGLAP